MLGAIAAGVTLLGFTVRLAESTGPTSVTLPALVVELCMLAMAASRWPLLAPWCRGASRG